MHRTLALAPLAVLLTAVLPVAGQEPPEQQAERQAMLADHLPTEDRQPLHLTACIGGMAAGFPCSNVDLLELMPLATIGGGQANDLWGWTDPMTGKEYALLGRTTGTSFVDITDPEEPIYLGNLPSHTGSSVWRDVKTYANHAYIVSDSNGNHGMQVFDLTQLRNVVSPPVTFSETAHYAGFGSAHNLVIDEATGFAYAVGGSSGTTTCSGGLHMIDLANPESPTFAGCYSGDGYTHDAQCVVYSGPDVAHQGREICFASNEDTLTIVDVTDKAAPVQLSRTPYSGRGYTHQGWLSEDQVYFLLDDELDEQTFGHNTRTRVWNLTDLDAPVLVGFHDGATAAIDHNQYVRGEYVYQANYRSGLRILHLDDLATATLTEAAYFDVYPASDSANFNGSWSVYPYFASGVVIVSGIEQGLFILQPRLCTTPSAPVTLGAAAAGDQRIDLSWAASAPAGATFRLYRALGACPGDAPMQLLAADLATPAYSDTTVSGGVPYAYQVTVADASGLCESVASPCADAVTTGPCTAPPSFAGLAAVDDQGSSLCALALTWPAATANCGGPVSYSVYRSTTSGFTPGPDNLLASGLTGTTYLDTGIAGGAPYFYVVRAGDQGNGIADANSVERSATPTGPAVEGTFSAGAEIGDPALGLGSGLSGVGLDHLGWHLSTARFHSGTRSYFSEYGDNQCSAVRTPPVELVAGGASTLSFWSVFATEASWDGGVVELSVDGGLTWSPLSLSPSYPGAFNNGADACGFATGRPSFTGSNLTWTQYTADLSAHNGSEVLVRWNFSTDGGVTSEGWYVDDVAISHALVPGACFADDLIFADSFASGDLSAWSAASTDGGDLAPSPAADLDGDGTGLAALVDDAVPLWVADDSPAGESRYRARFYLDPNGFTFANDGERTKLFQVLEDLPTRRLVTLVLRRLGGEYKLLAKVHLDDGTWVNTGFLSLSDAPHRIEIDWRRASAPGAGDGTFELFLDGGSVSSLTGLDIAASTVDSVRMGVLKVKPGASGSLFFDGFESRRFNFIGP